MENQEYHRKLKEIIKELKELGGKFTLEIEVGDFKMTIGERDKILNRDILIVTPLRKDTILEDRLLDMASIIRDPKQMFAIYVENRKKKTIKK